MTDVFISYSRRDKIFTQKLVNSLQAANREVWADWASIPAASDWDAEIKEGIEKTDTVLFLLSPEWIKSNECRKEMIHAIQHGKRLVPILHIMPDQGQEVPPELAKLNWVYMRETDDFDKAFETLQSAMDTDLDWVKTHTRIQVRAIEWSKRSRDNSLTLRGNDLTEAEQFISQGAHKTPEPTELQGEYILISRKDATRRQRLTLAGVTIALVVSIAMGIVAYFQRQAAVLNSKISFARELIAASENSIESDPERSILLALQAIQITTDAGQDILPSAENALRNAIQSSRVRYTATIPNDSVTSVAFSPDGNFAAAGTEKGKLIVWRVFNTPHSPALNGDAIDSFWLEEVFSTPETNNAIQSISFSPDGKLLAASNDEAGVPAIWDFQTGEKLYNLSGDIGFINQITFNSNGTYIATGGDDGAVRVWDSTNGTQISFNGDHVYSVAGVSFNPDGTLVASTGESGRILFTQTETGAIRYSHEGEPYMLTSIAFSPRGDLIAYGTLGWNVKVLDLNTNEVINTKLHKEVPTDIAFSPDGNLVITTGVDGKGIAIDPYTGKRVFTLSGDTTYMLAVAFSPDNNFVATGNSGGEFKIWDASIIPPSEAGIISAQNQPFTGLEFFDNGSQLITSGDEPVAHLYDAESQNSTELYYSPSWINDVGITPDQKLVAISDETGVVSVWNASDGENISTLSGATGQVYDIEFNPDGSLLTGAADFGFIWDVSSGELLHTFDTGYWNMSSTFNPEGNLLAVGDGGGAVTLFDINSGSQIWKNITTVTSIRSLAFTPDGTGLVSGRFDGEAILLDVATGNEIRRFSGHVAGITNVAISPDGTQLATSSSDSTVKVWDLASGELSYTLAANKFYEYFWVNNVAFTPEGNLLATGSEDGVVRYYFTNMDDVLKLAYSRITRTLSEEECETYLHEDTCPKNIVKPEKSTEIPQNAGPLISLPPVEVIPPSDPDLRTNEDESDIYLDIRNKTTEGITIYWMDGSGQEQILGSLAPSEVLRFSSWGGHAFRLKDTQNFTVMEYVATNIPYQQINIRTLLHIPSSQTAAESSNFTSMRVNYQSEDGSNTGYFLTNEPGIWIEKNSDGNFAFTEIERTETLITLKKFDGVLIVIDIEKKLVSIIFPDSDGSAQPLYRITTVEGNASQTVAGEETASAVTETIDLKSGNGSAEVTLKFINQTDQTLRLNWMNFEGGEESFLEIAPGETIEQGTYETHAWRLRDPDGNLLFEIVATNQTVQEFTINTDLTVTAK